MTKATGKSGWSNIPVLPEEEYAEWKAKRDSKILQTQIDRLGRGYERYDRFVSWNNDSGQCFYAENVDEMIDILEQVLMEDFYDKRK